MPRVSIITPTENRHQFLDNLWDCIQAQTVKDWEWLIYDTTPVPWLWPTRHTEPRINYIHRTAKDHWTIGAKRNHLCLKAKGEIIAHFDDDDYYAPHYLHTMLELMASQHAEFVKLFGFYVYHQPHKVLGYIDLAHDFPVHYIMDPNAKLMVTPTHKYPSGPFDHWGYGFNYVYTKRVWDQCKFDQVSHGEDIAFARLVLDKFNCAGMQDWTATCLHRIHAGNTSRAFPQQLLPKVWLTRLFPYLPREPDTAI